MLGFLGRVAVKSLPVGKEVQEMRVRSLNWEVPLDVGLAPHSSILAWRVPGTEEFGRVQSMGSQSRTGRKQLSRHAQWAWPSSGLWKI